MPMDQTTRVIGLFPELLGIGGIQEASRVTAAAIMAAAPSRNWTVNFLSLNDPAGKHKVGVAGQSIEFVGYGRGKIRFALAALFASHSSPAAARNVVLATHPNLAPLASLIRRSSPRTRSIVMSHGIEVWSPLPTIRRRSLTKADVVLGPSTYTVKKLAEVQNVDQAKAQRLPWPINPWFLRMSDSGTRLSRPSKFPPAPVILTVGRWVISERYKGTDDLIKAVAQLRSPGVNLAVVGSGDDLPRLRKLAADLGLGERAMFFENLPREELAACYAYCDIFALPSAGEGFGLVFLEAMAFSKPIIGASFGGAVDVIENDVNGLVVPPHDPEQLSRTLERLLQDASHRERLGRRGGELVREKYRFEVFQEELAGIVEG